MERKTGTLIPHITLPRLNWDTLPVIFGAGVMLACILTNCITGTVFNVG
jgi:hypothetical protein